MKLSEEEIKQKYLRFKLIQQQIEQLSEHAQGLNQQSAELDISLHALDELQTIPDNSEILAPIAEGIFFKAKLQEHQTLIVNIGSYVTAEKTIPEILALLKEQKEKVMMQLIQTEAIMQELNEQGMKIYKEIEKEQG